MPSDNDSQKNTPPWWVFLFISVMSGGVSGLGSFTALGNQHVQPREAEKLDARIDLVEEGARKDRENIRARVNANTDQIRRIDYECKLVDYKCNRLQEQSKGRSKSNPQAGDVLGSDGIDRDLLITGGCQFCDG